MKKSIPKIAIRRETIRMLGSLELKRALGGDAGLVADTGREMCTTVVAKPPLGG